MIIGTELRDDREQETRSRQRSSTRSPAPSVSKQTGKLDFNNAGEQALVDRLRDPLQRAGVAMTEQQLQDLATSIMNFRDTPPRSGFCAASMSLQGVPGVTPQVISVLKQEAYLAPYAIRNVEMVGPEVGAELRQQGDLRRAWLRWPECWSISRSASSGSTVWPP